MELEKIQAFHKLVINKNECSDKVFYAWLDLRIDIEKRIKELEEEVRGDNAFM